jgi:hypothetical protein
VGACHEQVANEAALWLSQGRVGISGILFGVQNNPGSTTGSYKYGKQKIDWSYKPVKKVFDLWLKSKPGANGFQQFDHLDIVVTINHDKGRS